MPGGEEFSIRITPRKPQERKILVGESVKPRGLRVSELKKSNRVTRLDEIVLPEGEVLTNEERRKIIAAQKAGERYVRTVEFKTWREEVDATAARVAEERAETTKAYGELPVATENDLSKEQGINDEQVRKDMAECVGNVLENPDPEAPLYDEQNLIGEKIEELLTEEGGKRRRNIMDQFLADGFSPNVFLKILAPETEDQIAIASIDGYNQEIILIRNRLWALALRQMATKGHNLHAVGRYSPKYDGIMKNTFFFSPSAACADGDSGSTEIATAKIDLNDLATYLYTRKEGALDIGGTNTAALAISVPRIGNYYPLDPKQLTLTQKTEMAQYWKDNAILQPAA